MMILPLLLVVAGLGLAVWAGLRWHTNRPLPVGVAHVGATVQYGDQLAHLADLPVSPELADRAPDDSDDVCDALDDIEWKLRSSLDEAWPRWLAMLGLTEHEFAELRHETDHDRELVAA